jgi:hypothetical protein
MQEGNRVPSVVIMKLVAFFSVTPDDEYDFRAQMYVNQGKEIKIPSRDCSEAECIYDFELR